MSTPALNARFGADISELKAKMSEASGLVDRFGKNLNDIAGAVGLAFGVQQVGAFALEITKLAGQADGVRQAFYKLSDATSVLQQLKDVTHGTVSEFDLMKAAVQANNFNIPIQQLGNLFQFAYERAKATGQSVDYLVQSIVLGIGRKSPLILDNLGISAVALREKFNGLSAEAATVGDVAKAVGEIATTELAKMGRSADTAAEKIARIETNWENLKVKMGTGTAMVLDPLLEGLNLLTGGGNKGKGELLSMIYESGRQNRLAEDIEMISRKAKAAGVDLRTLTGETKEVNRMLYDLNLMLSKAQTGPSPAGSSPLGPFVDATKKAASAAAPDAGMMSMDFAFNPDEHMAAADSVMKLRTEYEILDEAIRMTNEAWKGNEEVSADVLNNQSDQMDQLKARTEAMVDGLGAGFGRAAAGYGSLADAIASSSRQIVEELSNTAFAGLIANIMKTVPFPFNIGLIAAGKAFLAAQLSGIGGGSRGGGGGGAGYSERMNRSNSALMGRDTQTMQGRVVIDGTQLQILFGRQSAYNGYTQPAFAPIGG